jgi:hypothetical protein
MGDPSVSRAGRVLSLKRWGSSRPRNLAKELLQRLEELPPSDRQRLREALDHTEPLGGDAA